MENVEDVYALAPIQEGLVYHTIRSTGSGVFVDQVGCVIRGDFDIAVFKRAWALLTERHGALRTGFLWDGLDEPLQVVRQHVDVPWVEEDWRSLTPAERGERFDSVLSADRRRGFEIDEAPLLRMCVIRLGENEWRWLWTFHHLISDGWSTAILVDEVFTAYAALHRGEAPDLGPTFKYRDYIAWHAGQQRAEAEAFWRQELAGFVSPGILQPLAPPHNAAAPQHEQLECCASPAVTQAMVALASSSQVTLNTLFQAAWGLLLSKYLHDDDIVFGITTAGRPPDLPNVERGVGLFINTLPLRQVIDPKLPLRRWLKQLQQKHFELLGWESTALVDIQRWSDVAPGQALFDNILVFENYPRVEPASDGGGLQRGELDIIEHSNYPLAVLVVPGESLRCIAVYDTARFDAAFINRLLARLLGLLASFVADADKALGAYSLLAQSELAEIVSRDGVSSGGSRPRSTVLEQIADSVARCPDADAVHFAGGVLSYRALDQQANRVASALRANGVTKGAYVGIYANRCAEMVVAILGVLRAGGAYVPMDAKYPEEHTRFVIEDAALDLVLTTEALFEQARGLGATLLSIEALADDAVSGTGVAPSLPAADDPAYVIYTSGSTGKPKGVVVSHANLLSSNTARADFYGAAGRFLLQSSFAFDSSVAGIFWSLSTGGSLVLSADGIEQDMQRLVGYMHEKSVTHTLCLPSLYDLILDSAREGQLDALRGVVVAGEACSAAVVQRHFEQLPGVGLFNEYGPTEATVWSTVHRVSRHDAGAEIPIGTPVDGVELWLVDQHGQPVPDGVAGEIYLGGEALAQGYLNQPELTAAHFVDLAPCGLPSRRLYRTGDLAWRREDGCLMFLGRSDSQIKIRGFRVELRGIEQVLKTHPAIVDAAVAMSDSPDHGARRRIVAFLVSGADASSEKLSVDAVRAFLAQRLPDYMLPDSFMVLDGISKLPNGKTDYRALPVNEAPVLRSQGKGRPPTTDDEITLAGIWKDLMGLESLSVDDSFFDLGGDSIISIQMISRARQAGVAIDPQDLARYTTIAGLASLVRDCGERKAGNLFTFRQTGERPPLFCIHAGGEFALPYRHLARCLGEAHPVYAVQPPGLDGEVRPLQTIEELAEHYISEIRSVQSRGPYYLIGYCIGATVALEMARQLERAGERVAHLFVLDSGFWWHERVPVSVLANDGTPRVRKVMRKIGLVLQRDGARVLYELLARNIAHVYRESFASLQRRWRLRFGDEEIRRQILRDHVQAVCNSAFQRYDPQPCGVPGTLIRTTEFLEIPEKERHLRWRDMLSTLNIRVVDGLHDTILSGPEIADVARIVSDRMRRVEAGDLDVR